MRAAVVGLLDEMLGQVIKAFVVCRVGITASFEELVALCKEELRVIWRRSLLK
jgi:acyl-coenzyme A synthetase/AMP-(fatty) acid ligase